MAEKEPFRTSDLYEYILHDETDNTLQVFTSHTMSSTNFSAKQALDLLTFLEANREKIEALASQLQTERKQHKSIHDSIDNLFSSESEQQ